MKWHVRKRERDRQLFNRYIAGETPKHLSKAFEISLSRVYQLLARSRREQARELANASTKLPADFVIQNPEFDEPNR